MASPVSDSHFDVVDLAANVNGELVHRHATDDDDDDNDIAAYSEYQEEESLLYGDTDTKKKTYTVNDAVEHIGLGRFQMRLILICGLLQATDALEMMLLSVLSPVLRCEWMLAEWQVALVTTVVFLGMFSGSSIWGSFSDRYGRKPIVFIAASWIFYFGFLTSFSPSYYWILILRGLVGWGFGGAIQSFTLLTEYIPSKPRAKVLIISGITWACGSSFEILMAYLIIPTIGWRYLVAFSALPSLLTVIFIAKLPESARYLVAAGHIKEAKEVLAQAAATNKTVLPAGELVASQTVARGRFKDLFQQSVRRTTFQLWLLWFGTACLYYGIVLAQSDILEFNKNCDAGQEVHEDKPIEQCHCNLLTGSDYVGLILATFGEFVCIPLNLLIVDTLGRRWTLTINCLLASLFFFLLLICTSRIFLIIFMFGVRTSVSGLFNITYIYTSEYYPTNLRSVGLGTCSSLARIGCMITPFIAQVLLHWSLTAALVVYGTLALICGLTTFMLPTETMGRVLTQHND